MYCVTWNVKGETDCETTKKNILVAVEGTKIFAWLHTRTYKYNLSALGTYF